MLAETDDRSRRHRVCDRAARGEIIRGQSIAGPDCGWRHGRLAGMWTKWNPCGSTGVTPIGDTFALAEEDACPDRVGGLPTVSLRSA